MKSSISTLSCNAVLDSRVTPDGLSKIYFRIREGRVKRDIYTKIRWPRDLFDKKNQQLIARFPEDPDVIPYNLKLNEYKSIAHRLQINGYMRNNSITIDDIIKEFQFVGKSSDFFTFMDFKIKEIYNDSIIVYDTYRRHRSSLNIVKKFSKSITLQIHTIDLDWIQRFDAWCRRVHKVGHNTICGYHKDVKKYLGIAVRKGLILENPYKEFSFAYVDGNREALTKEEVQSLYKSFCKPLIPDAEREICCRFLFSCITGLRISDTSRIHRNNILDNTLIFVAYKGFNKGKIIKIPLPKIALELIAGRDGKIFYNYSHSYINETLKIIAARSGILKRLTYHCARDTFGTLFIEMGGDVKSLKDLMGHTNLKTTMIYLKMSDKRKQDLMNNFDSLF